MAKSTTDDYLNLRIGSVTCQPIGSIITSTWTRSGYTVGQIQYCRTDENTLIMRYTHHDEPQHYTIRLLCTTCNYGGTRAWFECPSCCRRVGVLYSGRRFLCRHCRNLNYPSTRQPSFYRVFDKTNRKLKKIDGKGYGFPNRPKGMHFKTYERLFQQWDKLDQTNRANYICHTW
ncbi:hypothetical protein [Neisseria perflava]|uniref:hypothetical protein n=1 Tax=Neisseria perflava TaxID=33053 RepID=UPI00209D2280|nr:hypothetical protein [Neisseria perflava]MCP1659106.1 hypothetical protein [Neisseria perflava]MCP1771397.1 hypothetical protein [Neisseria perflava]